jgi:hypothetical protein
MRWAFDFYRLRGGGHGEDEDRGMSLNWCSLAYTTLLAAKSQPSAA